MRTDVTESCITLWKTSSCVALSGNTLSKVKLTSSTPPASRGLTVTVSPCTSNGVPGASTPLPRSMAGGGRKRSSTRHRSA